MLVSVIVATYNCSKFVETTLDSVWKQTYSELELVVTDDGSTDHTNEFVDQWIKNHNDRFEKVVHVCSDKNTGVTANYQRGLEKASGTWVKCLDGDDLLVEDAVEKYVTFCKQHPDIKIVYAGEKLMDDDGNCYKDQPMMLGGITADAQMKSLLRHRLLGVRTTTNFFNRELFVTFGGFDAQYPMYQDGPLFLHFLTHGYPLGALDSYTIKKRENPTSLMHTANPVMVENISRCIYDFSTSFYLRKGMLMHYYNSWLTYWIARNSNRSVCFRSVGYLLRCMDVVNMVEKLNPKKQKRIINSYEL